MKKGIDLRVEELRLIETFSKSKDAGVLTILFSDLVGYTKFSEKHSENVVQDFRREHDKVLVDIIEKGHKGKVIKFMGDACMAIFASPTDAVKIAREAKNEVNRLIDNYSYDLDIRIGIHMGEVVVEDGVKKDVFGRHVNRAQRIEGLATSGQIFLSFPVYDSVQAWLDEDEYKFVNHGRYKLKGIKEDAEIYELCLNGRKPKPPYWKVKVKKYKLSFFLMLFVYLLTIALYFVKEDKIDVEVVSGKEGYVYINDEFQGELEKHLIKSFDGLKRFSKITIEVKGEKKNYYPIFANKMKKYELYRDVKKVEEENMLRVEAGKNALARIDDDLYISKFEVTQEDFVYVMNFGNRDEFGKVIADDKPVHDISWFDAIEYCNRVSLLEGLKPYYDIGQREDEEGNITYFVKKNFTNGYRLPTKDEWLYIAAGGNLSEGYLYSGSDDQNEVAIIGDWTKIGIVAEDVGSKKANELGIYDMSGNVSEWVEDDYNEYQKIVMGTAWSDKFQEELPLDKIKRYNSTGRYYNVGFRVARDI